MAARKCTSGRRFHFVIFAKKTPKSCGWPRRCSLSCQKLLTENSLTEKSEYIFEIGEVQSFRKIYIEIFQTSRKNLHFFLLHFSFSFSNSSKIFKSLSSSTQNYLFNKVLLLIISFFLKEELTKMCGLPELLE